MKTMKRYICFAFASLCLSLIQSSAEVSQVNVKAAQPNPAPKSAQNASEIKTPPEVEKAMQMPDGEGKTNAIISAAQEWAKKDIPAVLSWAQKLPPVLRGKVVIQIIDANPQVAADWYIQTNIVFFHGAIYSWAMKEPNAAAAWSLKSPESVRAVAVISAAEGWFLIDKSSAADWAAKLTSDEDRVAAIKGVALKWCRTKDAKDGLQPAADWLKKFKPSDIKEACKFVVGDWKANPFNNSGTRNDAAIKEWVNQFPLSEPDKNEILANKQISSIPSLLHPKK